MKKFFIAIAKAIILLALYFVINMAVGFIITGIVLLSYSEPLNMMQAMLLMAEISIANNMLILIITNAVTLVLLFVLVKVLKHSFKEEAWLKKVFVPKLALPFIGGIGLCLLIVGVLSLIPREITADYESASTGVMLQGSPILAAIAAYIVAPVFEEFFFRGFIFGSLKKGMNVWVAAVLQAVIFGAMHGPDPIWMAYSFVTGFLLALVAIRFDSIIASIIMHFGFNLTNLFSYSFYTSEVAFYVVPVLGACIVAVTGVLIWMFTRKPKIYS